MTQKELLYMEDAIKHEQNIIAIITETITMLESDDLISFLEREIKSHSKLCDKLLNVMEGVANG